MKVGPYGRLSTEELMLSNCGAGEDSLKSPLDFKDISQSKESNLEHSMEVLMLQLNLQ